LDAQIDDIYIRKVADSELLPGGPALQTLQFTLDIPLSPETCNITGGGLNGSTVAHGDHQRDCYISLEDGSWAEFDDACKTPYFTFYNFSRPDLVSGDPNQDPEAPTGTDEIDHRPPPETKTVTINMMGTATFSPMAKPTVATSGGAPVVPAASAAPGDQKPPDTDSLGIGIAVGATVGIGVGIIVVLSVLFSSRAYEFLYKGSVKMKERFISFVSCHSRTDADSPATTYKNEGSVVAVSHVGTSPEKGR